MKVLNFIKTIIFIAIVIVLAFIGYKFYLLKHNMFTKEEPVYSSEIIEEKITKISELVTLDYFYTNAEKTDPTAIKFFKWNIPFTEKYLIVKYNGRIKFSTDLSKATIDLQDTNLVVTLPHCVISSHEIDENSWQYLDQKSGLFNGITLEDGDEIRKNAKSSMEKRVEELDLISQADKNAIQQLEQFLKSIYSDLNIEINIK